MWLCGIARHGGLSASNEYGMVVRLWWMFSADADTNVAFFMLTLEQHGYRHFDRSSCFYDKTVFPDRASVVASVDTFHICCLLRSHVRYFLT